MTHGEEWVGDTITCNTERLVT